MGQRFWNALFFCYRGPLIFFFIVIGLVSSKRQIAEIWLVDNELEKISHKVCNERWDFDWWEEFFLILWWLQILIRNLKLDKTILFALNTGVIVSYLFARITILKFQVFSFIYLVPTDVWYLAFIKAIEPYHSSIERLDGSVVVAEMEIFWTCI